MEERFYLEGETKQNFFSYILFQVVFVCIRQNRLYDNMKKCELFDFLRACCLMKIISHLRCLCSGWRGCLEGWS